jgi:hypothetical protein
MYRTCGSLSCQCDEAVSVLLRWVSDHSGRGESGIGEKLGFGIRDFLSGSDGIRGEDGRGIGLTCPERPPGESSEHSGLTGGNVCVSVAVCSVVEQPFGPG